MNVDGTGVRTVGGSLDVTGVPSWSSDGKWIAVVANTAHGPRLFKVPVDGGAAVQLTTEIASRTRSGLPTARGSFTQGLQSAFEYCSKQ